MDPVTAVYLLVAALVISYALAPKPPNAPPPALDDIEAPTAEEGRAIPVIFGDVWVDDPNVVWYGDLQTEPIYGGGGGKK